MIKSLLDEENEIIEEPIVIKKFNNNNRELTNKTIEAFLLDEYDIDINIINNNKKGLIIALQIELNRRGADLSINGIFDGQTKTAYAKYAGIITKGSKDKIVIIWKYILAELGYTFKKYHMTFDKECLDKTVQYQQSLKTLANGVVGFNLLTAALK